MIRPRTLSAVLLAALAVVAVATVGGTAFGQSSTPAAVANSEEIDQSNSQQSTPANESTNDTGGWNSPRADAGATGATDDDGPHPYANTSWQARSGAEDWTPVVVGGSVVMASADGDLPTGSVESYDVATGETKWTQDDLGEPVGPATGLGSTVFVSVESDVDGFRNLDNRTGLYGLDAATGDVEWRRNASLSAPVATDGRVFVSERPTQAVAGDDVGYGNVTAVDAATGDRVWTSDVQGKVVAAADGRLVVTDEPSDTLMAVSTDDGSLLWRTEVQEAATLRDDVAATDYAVYVTNGEHADVDETNPKTVTAFAASDGTLRWETAVGNESGDRDGNPSYLSAPAVANGTVYVVTNDDGGADSPDTGGVHALDADSGERQWSFRTRVTLRAHPVVANGTVYAAGMYRFQEEWADDRNADDVADWRRSDEWLTAYALDADTGAEQWNLVTDAGREDSGPYAAAAADGRLYVTTYSQGIPGYVAITAIESTDDRPPWYFHAVHDQSFQDAARPVARLTTSPPADDDGYYDRNTTVTLNASQSTDEDGEIVGYEWDVDHDGEYETTGVTATVTTDELACVETTVTLRVTDDDGNTDTVTRTLQTQPDDS